MVMPLTWILICLAFALFSKKENRRKKALVLTAVLLLFFTNPFIVNCAYLGWECPPTSFNSLQRYDAAIILTGFTGQDKSPHDRVYTNKGADRILLPLRLYKEGYFKNFIITGGSGSLLKKHSTEADELKQILLHAGVPEQNIFIEDKSRNTHENAQFSKRLLEKHPAFQQLLLVTSAFHMRRAKGCFAKEKIMADSFPADFYSSDISFTPDRLLIPQESALYLWQRLLHEMLGYITYKAAGYL